jgi:hypothetical protein
VAIAGVGAACGIIKGKLVIPPIFVPSAGCAADPRSTLKVALELVAGVATLPLLLETRPKKDADDDENNGMPITAMATTNMAMRTVELKLR